MNEKRFLRKRRFARIGKKLERSLETVYHTDRIRVSTNTRNNYFEHSEIFCTSEHVQTTSMEGKREEGPYFRSF